MFKIRSFKGSFMLITKKDNVDTLRQKRKQLQVSIRDYVDTHADPQLRGWWRDPSGFNEKIKEKQNLFVSCENRPFFYFPNYAFNTARSPSPSPSLPPYCCVVSGA